MNLTNFPEQTHVIAEDQPEYLPMPAFAYANDPEHKIVCCWSLNWRERLRLLVTGKIWHTVLTFGSALQLQSLTLKKPFTHADVNAAKYAKEAFERRVAWHDSMVEKYGKKCVLKNIQYDRHGYHPNDRRRIVKFDPEDFQQAKSHGILFLMGCRIVDEENKTAV